MAYVDLAGGMCNSHAPAEWRGFFLRRRFRMVKYWAVQSLVVQCGQRRRRAANQLRADRERPRGGALRATFRMLCWSFWAYRGGDPMTHAHGLVRLYAATVPASTMVLRYLLVRYLVPLPPTVLSEYSSN